jgi:hypothetical protein
MRPPWHEGSVAATLGDRKAKLARLLARAPAGIVFNEHTDADGAVDEGDYARQSKLPIK